MAAIFRRIVNENTDSNCKDTPISPFYNDVYDGQGKIFSNTGIAGDGIPGVVYFGRGIFPLDYLCEFPMPPIPKFGEATLDNLELNLYFSDIQAENDYTPLALEIYKMKEPLQTEGDFTSLVSGTEDIYFASSTPTGYITIEENFSGGEVSNLGLGAFDRTSGFYYINSRTAWNKIFTGLWEFHGSRSNMDSAIGQTYKGEDIVRIEYVRTMTDHERDYRQAGSGGPDNQIWKSYKEHKRDFWPDAHPTFALSAEDIHHTGARIDTSALADTQIDISNSPLIESLLSTKGVYVPGHSGGTGGDPYLDYRDYTSWSKAHYQDAGGPTVGPSLFMAHYIDVNELNTAGFGKTGSDTRAYYLEGGTAAPYQEHRFWFSVPSPVRLDNVHGSSVASETFAADEIAELAWEQGINLNTTTNELGVQVEMTMKIDEMMTRTVNLGDYDGRGNYLTRALVITAATRPPHKTERLHNYLYNMIERSESMSTNLHPKHVALGHEPNNSFGGHVCYTVAIMNDLISDDRNPASFQEGLVYTLGSGSHASYNINGKADHYDNVWINSDAGHSLRLRPDGVPKMTTTDFTPTGRLHSLDGSVEKGRPGIALKDWFKIVFAFDSNYTKELLKVYFLDSNGDIVSTAKTSGTLPLIPPSYTTNFTGNTFPRYFTVWLTNEKISADENYDPLYRATETGTKRKQPEANATAVYVDGIVVRGFENDVSNTTMGIRNTGPASASIKIAPSVALFNLSRDEDLSPSNDDVKGKKPKLGHDAGIEDDDGEISGGGLVPTYLNFGFTSNVFPSSGNPSLHLFLGGFHVDNQILNERPGGGGYFSDDVVMFMSTEDAKIGRTLSDRVDSKVLTSYSRPMGTRHFTRKGFISLDPSYSDDNGYSKTREDWTKRENQLVATKILDISLARSGKIIVADPQKLLSVENEEYVIFRSRFTDWNNRNTVWKTGLKLHRERGQQGSESNILYFASSSGKSVNLEKSNDGTPLCVNAFLDELYISPYRYWLITEIWNKGSEDGGNILLPDKTYSHCLALATDPVSGLYTEGMTFNEFLYSDAPISANQWSFAGGDEDNVFEQGTDYGFGTVEDKDTGYIRKKPATLKNSYTSFDLKGLVNEEESNLVEEGAKVTLYVKSQDTSTAKGLLHISKDTTTSTNTYGETGPYMPYMNVVYRDELPEVEDFKVEPNEVDPFYPKYTWSANNDDLWYGFIILDEESIEHQYHGAVAHIPCNEDFIYSLYEAPSYLYRYDGTYGGTRVAATQGYDVTKTIEGLAGFALDFDATSDRYIYWDDDEYTDPTTNASIVAHVVVDSRHDALPANYIVSKYQQFELYIDIAGNVNAKLFYSASASVNLKSVTLVNEDGETPTNIIVTFDKGIPSGNCKLFVNGKLEDQSGIKTPSGSTHNWKIGSSLYASTGKLIIGLKAGTALGGLMTNHFVGHIEEITIYNKTIYPVVPQTGELTIYKPIEELTIASIAAGKSIVAKLFIKDYHNIRGTTTNHVASTSMVAYRKSGLGLNTERETPE